MLLRMYPSPVVELNRSVAVTMRDGPEAGLVLVDTLISQGRLENYHFLYAVQADLYRRLGKTRAACAAYQQALERVQQELE